MKFRDALCLVAPLLLGACSSTSQSTPTAPLTAPTSSVSPVRVLMLTATRGFHHDSIPAAVDTMKGLAAANGVFTLDVTEDVASINAASLAAHDVLFFALTTG